MAWPTQDGAPRGQAGALPLPCAPTLSSEPQVRPLLMTTDEPFFFDFLRQSVAIQFRLALGSLCSPGCSQTGVRLRTPCLADDLFFFLDYCLVITWDEAGASEIYLPEFLARPVGAG